MMPLMTPRNSGRPQVGVGLVVTRNDTILVGKRISSHGDNTFGWIGGHLEFGETLEACAVREAFEEAGICVEQLRFLCVSNVVAYGKHYVDFEFVAERWSGEPTVCEPHRIIEWGWYHIDSLPTPLFRAAELAIHSLRTGK